VHIPVLDMVELSIAKLAALPSKPKKIGMLASPAVRLVGLYETRLRDAGLETVFPDAANEEKILNVIRAVKSATVTEHHCRDYSDAARSMLSIDAALIACTELSVFGAPKDMTPPSIDALDVLVGATIAEARG
jgi:aspartate racemase